MPTPIRPTGLAGHRRWHPPPPTLAGLPLMLTIGETAEVLRIRRTSAYKLAEAWRTSGGESGLPTVRLGSRLLVRRVDFAVLVGLDLTG